MSFHKRMPTLPQPLNQHRQRWLQRLSCWQLWQATRLGDYVKTAYPLACGFLALSSRQVAEWNDSLENYFHVTRRDRQRERNIDRDRKSIKRNKRLKSMTKENRDIEEKDDFC
jgi:hypothetical protein